VRKFVRQYRREEEDRRDSAKDIPREGVSREIAEPEGHPEHPAGGLREDPDEERKDDEECDVKIDRDAKYPPYLY